MLFEPFPTTSERSHGLGLWIVYQIQQLGGESREPARPLCGR